ncbi:hypothetical protein BaRGS_00037875, partial [Batillaria attramentaria]
MTSNSTSGSVGLGTETSTKRLLEFSPSSDQNDAKQSRLSSSADTGGSPKCMSSPDPTVITSDIHETILTRVNEALKETTMEDVSAGENAFLRQVVPALVTAVSVAVGEAIDRVFRQREKDLPTDQKLQTTLERVHGGDGAEVTDDAGEDVEAKVLKIFQDCGANIKPDDISVVHRTGQRKRRGGRSILVRFVSRKKKQEVMRAKKSLKDKGGYAKVFINEDLTPLRTKLLHYTRALDVVERAWTSEGKIWAVKKRSVPGSGHPTVNRPVCIENPDDLFDKLG